MSATPPSLPMDSAQASYRLRWRGREEGPLSLDEIQRRLGTQEIGMLHEIYSSSDGWMTLRAFFDRRSRAEQEERTRREVEETRRREEAERDAEERAARHQEEMLAEEKRRNDLLQAAVGLRSPAARSRFVARNITLLAALLFGLLAGYETFRLHGATAELDYCRAEAKRLAITISDALEERSVPLGISIVLGDLESALREARETLKDASDRNAAAKLFSNRVGLLLVEVQRVEVVRNVAAFACLFSIVLAIISHNRAKHSHTYDTSKRS